MMFEMFDTAPLVSTEDGASACRSEATPLLVHSMTWAHSGIMTTELWALLEAAGGGGGGATLSVWQRACRRSGESTESMTSASVMHCLDLGLSDDAGGSGIDMQDTVCPFSVAVETNFTVGLSGDSTTLGSNAEDSFINEFSGKLTGTR